MKRVILMAIAGLALAAKSPAPIYDPPPDFKPTPERSQEQVAAEQKYQTVQGTVGAVETDTTPDTAYSDQNNSQAAAEISSSQAAASNDLQRAETDLKSAGSAKGKSWGMGIFLLIVGLAAFVGFRQWASRTVPLPAHLK